MSPAPSRTNMGKYVYRENVRRGVGLHPPSPLLITLKLAKLFLIVIQNGVELSIYETQD